jgi:predicted DsbA family dithiol-disulfide isomerase
MPPEGMDRRTYRAAKFGSWQTSQRLDAEVAAVGTSEGIHFACDRIARTPNTFDAHRLVWLAGQHGVQDAVVDVLFTAYFEHGRDVGDRAVLVDLGAEAGIDRKVTGFYLNSGGGAAEVRAEAEARRLGISGVPSCSRSRCPRVHRRAAHTADGGGHPCGAGWGGR